VARRKRLHRKELKQPDEFLTLTAKALIWGRAHPQFVTWGTIGALVVAVAIFVFTAFQSARSNDSNTDLGRVMLAHQSDASAEAAKAFAEVAQRWSSTPAGKVAAILAANAELRQGNEAGGADLLKQLLDARDGLPDYIRQELLFDWGYSLERRESWNDAAEKYAAAAALQGPFAAPALLGEARVRERAGDTERAQQLYAVFAEKFPDFPDHAMISAKIAEQQRPAQPASPIAPATSTGP
jgi:hypothetical protein